MSSSSSSSSSSSPASPVSDHVDNLVVSLSVTNKRVGATYSVKVFTSSPSSHPDSHEHEQIFTGDSIVNHEIRHQFNAPPLLLHVWLFSDTPVEFLGALSTTAILAQGRAVYANVYNKGGAAFVLTDVEGNRQGTANITCAKRNVAAVNDADAASVRRVALFKSVYKLIYDKYEELRKSHSSPHDDDDMSNFYFVKTNMDQLPITTFPFISTLIDNEPSDIHDLLVSMLRHVSPTQSIHEMLVDICTMLPRMLIYTDDIIRLPRGDDEIVDQWTQLGTLPQLHAAGFDCEDGSGLVLMIIHAIRTLVARNNTPPLLIELQRLAHEYTPFLTLGNLKYGDSIRIGKRESELDDNDAYVSHAYVVMLDKRWVSYHLAGRKGAMPSSLRPALSFESTASVSGAWDRDALADIGVSSSAIVTEFDNLRGVWRGAFSDDDEDRAMALSKLRAMCRQRTPLQASNAERWAFNAKLMPHRGGYQDVYVLMSPSHISNGRNDVVHLIVTGRDINNKGVIGALAENVLSYSPHVELHIVSVESRVDFELKYMCLWSEQPKNKLPLATMAVSREPAFARRNQLAVVGYIDISARVWYAYQSDLKQRIASLSHLYDIDTSEAMHAITADLRFKRVYFLRK